MVRYGPFVLLLILASCGKKEAAPPVGAPAAAPGESARVREDKERYIEKFIKGSPGDYTGRYAQALAYLNAARQAGDAELTAYFDDQVKRIPNEFRQKALEKEKGV